MNVLATLAANAARLAQAWMDEDAAACAPGGQGDGPGKQGPSDPTHSIATQDRKFGHRDRLGSALLSVSQRLEREVEAIKPRTPTERCHCCEVETATHGHLCFACQLYRRKMDTSCTEEVHRLRPRVVMCECPTECCDVCPDRAAQGRTGSKLSDRCAKRKSRGMWQMAS